MGKKYFCRTCRGLRKHEVLFLKNTKGQDEDGYLMWNEDFFVIECSGCETISFVQEYGDSDMYGTNEEGDRNEYYTEEKIFPLYLESGVELTYKYLLPPTIKKIYDETIDALKSKCYILSAGGFRAIIEALCNHLKIKKSDLSTRIDLLHEEGHLTINESKRLHSVRFLGNDSLHELEVPKVGQLIIVLEVINHLLENIFIQDKKINGSIDVIIDTYEEFLSLIKKSISEVNVGQDLTLAELLGRSIRVVKKKYLDEFEKQLSDEVVKGNHDFISISATENGKKQRYRIEKLPEINWFD
jgi:hypothetical protein